MRPDPLNSPVNCESSGDTAVWGQSRWVAVEYLITTMEENSPDNNVLTSDLWLR